MSSERHGFCCLYCLTLHAGRGDALDDVLLEEEEQRKDERRGDYYGKDTFKNSNKKKRHNIYIFSLEDLDNDDIISMVETTPTFQRTKTVLESIQSKAIAEEEETFNNDAENGGITITF